MLERFDRPLKIHRVHPAFAEDEMWFLFLAHPALPRRRATSHRDAEDRDARAECKPDWRHAVTLNNLPGACNHASESVTKAGLRFRGAGRKLIPVARVAELAYAPDLGSGPERVGGSSPLARTNPRSQRSKSGGCRAEVKRRRAVAFRIFRVFRGQSFCASQRFNG